MKTKKIVIFILLIFLFLNLEAQYRLNTLKYENSIGEKGTTYYLYNSIGKIYKAYWVQNSGTRSSENYYYYNQNNQLTRFYRIYSDGVTSEEFFEYDNSGKKIKETFKSDGKAGLATYIYNTDNRIIKQECKNYKGWFSGTILFKYKDSLIISAVIINNNNQIGTITYEYDTLGYLKKEFWNFYNSWNQTFYYEYEYDGCKINCCANIFIKKSCKYRLIEEFYDYNNQISGPSLYFYDSENHLIKKTFNRTDNFSTTTTYKYDKNGNITSSKRKDSKNKITKFVYEYNSENQLISKSFKSSGNKIGSEVYTYDKNGILKSIKYTNVDFWLTGEISIEYDQTDKFKSAKFKGDGIEADILFKYDENNNLVEIKWNFSDGKTQTYNFKYQEIINK